MTQRKFRVKLLGQAGSEVAALKPPFDVVAVFERKIIDCDPKAREFWPKLSFTHQKEYVREIEGAKRIKTRDKRVAAMMNALRKGQRKK
jgi:uncharacterized protein YdeI (YjbR/CyaY-like superfamily)